MPFSSGRADSQDRMDRKIILSGNGEEKMNSGWVSDRVSGGG